MKIPPSVCHLQHLTDLTATTISSPIWNPGSQRKLNCFDTVIWLKNSIRKNGLYQLMNYSRPKNNRMEKGIDLPVDFISDDPRKRGTEHFLKIICLVSTLSLLTNTIRCAYRLTSLFYGFMGWTTTVRRLNLRYLGCEVRPFDFSRHCSVTHLRASQRITIVIVK